MIDIVRDPHDCYVAGSITKARDGGRESFLEAKAFLKARGWNPYLPIEHPRSAECLDESRRLGDAYRSGPIYRELMLDFLQFIVVKASAVALLPSHVLSASAMLERDVGKSIGLVVRHYEFLGRPGEGLAVDE